MASPATCAWLQGAIESSGAALVPDPAPTAAQTDNTIITANIINTTAQISSTSGTTRKLVTVRMIKTVESFNFEHNIINVDGWTVVMKKDDTFFVDEFVVFLEADSFLPATKGHYGALFAEVGNPRVNVNQNGYRVLVRSFMNSRKQMVYSQGHIFKLSRFPEIAADVLAREEQAGYPDSPTFASVMRETDYAKELGIRKWEDSQPEGPISHGKVPSFVLKTDMERVQNCPNLFTKAKYLKFIFQESVKVDGASMSCYFVGKPSRFYNHLGQLPASCTQYAAQPNGRFGVCSKNCDLFPDDVKGNPYWATAIKNGLHAKLAKLGESIVVQGELVGWNIQGNPYGYPKGENDFIVFSVIDVDTNKRRDVGMVELFAQQQGLKHVKVLGYHTIRQIASSHQDLLDRADSMDGEGLVFKNTTDGRWFKVLSGRYINDRENSRANGPVPLGISNLITTATSNAEAAAEKTDISRPNEREDSIEESSSGNEMVLVPQPSTLSILPPMASVSPSSSSGNMSSSGDAASGSDSEGVLVQNPRVLTPLESMSDSDSLGDTPGDFYDEDDSDDGSDDNNHRDLYFSNSAEGPGKKVILDGKEFVVYYQAPADRKMVDIDQPGWEMPEEDVKVLINGWRDLSEKGAIEGSGTRLETWLKSCMAEIYFDRDPFPVDEIYFRLNGGHEKQPEPLSNPKVSNDNKPSGLDDQHTTNNGNDSGGGGGSVKTMSDKYQEYAKWLGLV
ncbi:RNA ligase-domain-containing protein [Lasiosphaeria hispida]|uniref:RNA ligase-domain-containing protein n=1 Tax=Lasiosphaeria hispida TaxID=260671 RepID=A0AAJ0HIE8_9PEZI|nr:RNA ligase-domain-containing protein [Lasiosphaeria hispida]